MEVGPHDPDNKLRIARAKLKVGALAPEFLREVEGALKAAIDLYPGVGTSADTARWERALHQQAQTSYAPRVFRPVFHTKVPPCASAIEYLEIDLRGRK